MAKASVVTKTVEVTLTLSIEEAEALRTLLWRHIAGKMNGKRELTNSIQSALEQAQVGLTELEALEPWPGAPFTHKILHLA